MLVSLLYVGLVRFVIRLKYIPVAAGSWFFLSTLNYDARSTTHQINPRLRMSSGVGACFDEQLVFLYL